MELTLGVTLAVLGAALAHAAWNALVKAGAEPMLDTALVALGSSAVTLRLVKYARSKGVHILFNTGRNVSKRASTIAQLKRAGYPVDGLCASFDAIYSGFDEVTRGFTDEERRALFHDNAIRLYRMK